MARLAHPESLKAWRECRGLAQAGLADAASTRRAIIRLFEGGEYSLSGKWRHRPALLLDVRPGDLTNSDPQRMTGNG
jgi:hypothetical protein